MLKDEVKVFIDICLGFGLEDELIACMWAPPLMSN